jgi:hypothetical protein
VKNERSDDLAIQICEIEILTYELLLQLLMMSLQVPTHCFYYQAFEVRKLASFDLVL